MNSDLIRFKQIFPFLFYEDSLLDAGCGTGDLLKFLDSNTNLKLTGIDIDSKKIRIAEENLENKNISLKKANILKLPFTYNYFDYSIASQILEHIPDWKKALNEVIRVTSRQVVITVPYEEKLFYCRCSSCGHNAFLHGHIHSFSEKDFEPFNPKFMVTFPYSIKKILYTLLSRKRKIQSSKGKDANGWFAICSKCSKIIPFDKRINKAFELIKRFFTGHSEYLLIQIPGEY